MGFLSNLFNGKSNKISEYSARGAVIIDVRSPEEYSTGAISQAQNIPLQRLENRIDEIKKLNTPIITCCASGNRSGSAAKILAQHGIEALNGGPWFSLEKKLK